MFDLLDAEEPEWQPYSSIRWWVPTNTNPGLAGTYEHRPVQIQRHHRRAPRRRPPQDAVTFRCPGKVLAPDLVAWVKEAHDLAGVGVERGDAVAFVVVAERAGEPEVIFFGLATERRGDDVVDLDWSADHALLGETVAAPVRACWETRSRSALGI